MAEGRVTRVTPRLAFGLQPSAVGPWGEKRKP